MTSPSGWHRKRRTDADRVRAASYRTPQYRAAEAAIKAQVAAGTACCWRCGRLLPTGRDRNGRRLWHVGHDDYDRTVIRGGECAPCNLTNAASKGATVTNNRRRPPGVTAYRM